ncbi:SNARE associated Golgi protein [Pseudoscourfieldia marina]
MACTCSSRALGRRASGRGRAASAARDSRAPSAPSSAPSAPPSIARAPSTARARRVFPEVLLFSSRGESDPSSSSLPWKQSLLGKQPCDDVNVNGVSLPVVTTLAALGAWSCVFPEGAHATAAAAAAAAAEGGASHWALIDGFYDAVEASGALGPALLFLVTLTAEMLPLVPTQPIYLTAGLIFGNTTDGLLPAWGGTVAAAGLSYAVARSLGKPGGALSGLVAFVFEREGNGEGGANDTKNNLKAKLEGLTDDGFAASTLKVLLLRFSPVVPYSISNYASGLLGIRFAPFFLGTALGMIPWAILYVGLGGTGHAALASGAEGFDDLLDDVVAQAELIASNPAARAVALTATGSLAAFVISSVMGIRRRTT